ncbi:MAG: hypothetical protein DMF89_09695 [Acidobacteria bacterium]|nr:MAG: hypothetical protein DMF89_09695 [Acidobacteriota bacterium]
MRTSVNTPHASRMAATIDTRRGPLESRRLAAAQATSARLKTGMAKMKIRFPIPAFSMDA